MIVQSLSELDTFLNGIQKRVSVDTETIGLHPSWGHHAVGYSFAYRRGDEVLSAYVPIRHTPVDEGPSFFERPSFINLDPEGVNARVRPLLEDAKISKILHHGKFDIQVLWLEGINLRNLNDTMILSHLLDPRRPNGLKKLMRILLREEPKEQGEIQKFMKFHGIEEDQKGGFGLLPIDVIGPYAAKDADATLRIFETLEPEMPRVLDIYRIERRLVPVLARMEQRGLPISKTYLEDLAERLRRSAGNVAARAFKVAGHDFEIGSPVAIAQILFQELRLPVPRGAKGLTDKSTLEKIEHPMARLITAYRQITKLESTYIQKMADLVTEKGRIHPSFQQVRMQNETQAGKEEHDTGASTGRIASSSPNIQNIATRRKVYKKGEVKTIEQHLVRRAFRIENNNVQFLLFDFSQIELRCLAHISQDDTLLAAYLKDPADDIHKLTAQKVFGAVWDRATEKERKLLRAQGKTVNFGVVYGIGPDRLAEDLLLIERYGLKRGVQMARDFLDAYFDLYPGVKELDQDLKQRFRRDGYIETLYGRRRPMFPSEEYKCLNSSVQGTAADMNKIALVRVEDTLQGFRSRLINNIHDEVTIEHWKEELEVQNRVREAMEEFPELSVPIKVDTSVAWPTWAHKKEVPRDLRPQG